MGYLLVRVVMQSLFFTSHILVSFPFVTDPVIPLVPPYISMYLGLACSLLVIGCKSKQFNILVSK